MKKILIIGATSAIAEATARVWAKQGHQLHLVARGEERLQAIAADLLVRGAKSTGCELVDALDLERHGAVIENAARTMGGIDVALIAHGTLPDQRACERNVQLAVHELNTNAIGVISFLTHLANIMEAQRQGTIAVISSVAGDRGRASNYVYGTAKAAVSTFCEGLRGRLFPSGVHVVDIRPGFVATPMTSKLQLPSALVAQPDKVASRIVACIDQKRDVVYVPAFWALIMLIIRWIPRFIFKRMTI